MQVVNKDPSRSEVRTFGWIMLGGFTVLGVLFWFLGLEREPSWRPVAGWGWNGSGLQIAAVVFWSSGLVFATSCLVSYVPGRRVYVAWMTGTMYLGIVMSTVMLTVLFFVLLPVFSLIRFKDPLRLKLKPSGSYWEDHTPHEPTVDRMRRWF